jgi:hypothetical protein
MKTIIIVTPTGADWNNAYHIPSYDELPPDAQAMVDIMEQIDAEDEAEEARLNDLNANLRFQ